jgi:HK97 family phage major capsid protein
MGLTPEELKQVTDAAADAASKATEAKKAEIIKEHDAEIVRTFTPGAGLDSRTKVLVDEGDQPWTGGLGEQLIAVKSACTSGGRIDKRLLAANFKATGSSEVPPSDGGFLVAQEFIPTLIEKTYQTAIVAGMCYRNGVGPNANGIKQPAIDETSRADGYRYGGIYSYWEAEGGTPTVSKPKFRQISMELQKIISLARVTDEMLQDSVQLTGYINKWYPADLAFKVDDAVINGDGSGKPLGMANSKNPALIAIDKETKQAAKTIITPNIINMRSRLWGANRKNSVWFISQDCEPQLEQLTLPIGTAGSVYPAYTHPGNPYNNGPTDNLNGRPCYSIEQCQTVGTPGDIILCDPGEYMIIDKGGVNMATSIHIYFVTDETAFRFTYRVNGQPMWHSPLTAAHGSTTYSPYIALAVRS